MDVDTSTTYQDKFIGLTQGPGTDGTVITGGVLLKGRDTTQTGLTAGSNYYASSTAGAIDTTSTAQPIGVAEDTDVLYFDPVLVGVAMLGQNNTWTGENTFTSATTTFDEAITGHASTTYTVYTTDSTWTKPSQFEYILVEVVGAGGEGGEGDTNVGGGGGGGGGYSKELLTTSDLSGTTSVAITVGAGGDSDVGAGEAGGTSSFGNFLSATGGSGGSISKEGGAGGSGSGGDLNVTGQGGGSGGDSGTQHTGTGGSSVLGGGARGEDGAAGVVGGNYGGGGSGGYSGSDAGNGANGVVIITVYY